MHLYKFSMIKMFTMDFMMKWNRLWWIALLGVFSCMNAFSQGVRPFKNGDRIAFVGNSITHGGHYHSYVWLYYMTHFPGRRIQVYNCGIGGDVTGGIYDRLSSDVFSRNPSVIFLTFGMNDAGYYEYLKPNAAALADSNVQKSLRGYQQIEKSLLAYKKAEVVQMTSPPFDETAKLPSANFPGKNEAMLRIADFQKASAEKNHWGFIDLNRPMTAINEREQRHDSSFTLEGQGRIHPDDDGHLVMAYLILRSQGLAGQPVADIRVDAREKKVDSSVNCRITGLTVSGGNVQFHYLARSLPFPIDTVVRGWGEVKPQSAALRVIPFMQQFDKENLTVSGLAPGEYQMTMDGQKVGSWSAEELGNGINLAEQPWTPEYRQALTIMQLNEERWEMEKNLRDYYWMEYMFFKGKGMLFHDDRAAIDTMIEASQKDIFVRASMPNYIAASHRDVRDAWWAEMNMLVNKIYTLNKPKDHLVELKRTGR